ncbi:ABC transporter substrate-binding protein [Natrarchaeobius sp. A-rgal3]|uniref:ABC transporter substrate-binding protein n=1 Tax=Natrarchaeobius versutus TaxID=1679078 RepID=UPI00350F32FC
MSARSNVVSKADRSRRRVLAGLGGLALGSTTAGCLGRDFTGSDSNRTIVDHFGREVTVPETVETVASYSPTILWTFTILGVQNKVIGITSGDTSEAFPKMRDVPVIGGGPNMNIEKIADLEPDLLFNREGGENAVDELDSLQEQFAEFDISVIGIDDRGLDPSWMQLLEEVLDEEGGFNDFLEWREEQLSRVEDGVSSLSSDERVSVLYERDYDPWEVQHDEPIEVAGGHNVMKEFASEEQLAEFRQISVDPERIIELDPDVAIKENAPGGARPLGWTGDDEAAIAATHKEMILDRSESDLISAWQNDEVYLVDYALMSGDKNWLGVLYLAKLFYPELFDDLDPVAVNEQYHEEWLGTEFRGTYLYPSIE